MHKYTYQSRLLLEIILCILALFGFVVVGCTSNVVIKPTILPDPTAEIHETLEGDNIQLSPIEDMNTPSHALSPTNSSLFPMTGHVAFVSRVNEADEIFLTNLETGVLKQLTFNSTYSGSPTWSPDGQKIAFVSYRDGNYNLYLMNADGSGQERLTDYEGYDAQPAWSPDGQQLAFVSKLDGNSEIYSLEVATGHITRLTHHPALDGEPAWSPNGKMITFVSDRDDAHNLEIYSMQADGSQVQRLTYYPESDTQPVWCLSGDCIIFARGIYERGRTTKLFSLDLNTGEITQLLTGELETLPEANEYFLAHSPTENFITFTISNNVARIFAFDLYRKQLFSLDLNGFDSALFP